ncbi:DUF262 domain-containing protein [Pseudomonas protegens]|uniref:DUF262 domain-containing protein n=1 Tax=Pseudomonas protegens TaxID=380021 RepID=UPI00287D9B2C|nr:DUF262 domain-containing protein [Pseudomonas protegens]MDS9873557.1 DUF262 domain-containing protein [Pseudomonas protegens]
MNLNIGQITLIDLLGMLERKELIINRNYQRGQDIWPTTARSYFIDTILHGFPFPKIYLYQSFSKETKKPFKELVDGQQRVTTIQDFYNNKFALSNTSKKFSGMRFRDLNEEAQQNFISYQIEHSTILSATRSELLEMFRRMNAYTAPLKEAEKRHSTYQGEFKWFIAQTTEYFWSELLESFDILTEKQIARMADAEFVSDMIVVLESGILTKRNAAIDKLYKEYDESFPKSEEYTQFLIEFYTDIVTNMQDIRGTFATKSYVMHSLFCAYAAIRYGYPGSDEFIVKPSRDYRIDFNRAVPRILELAEAHENQEDEGPHKTYVEACSSSTTQQLQRKIRTQYLVKALLG